MSQRLALLRARIGPRRTSRDMALRHEAAELFADITKARFLIERPHRRHLATAEATA